MKARLVAGLFTFLLAVPSFSAERGKNGIATPWPGIKTYTISKSYTTLSFTATKWQVFKEEGLFQDFSGTLTYSASDPAKCKIEVTVESASLDTRNSNRDKVLRSEDFFDVARYPTLGFHSTRVSSTGSGSYDVTGELTIHGVTRQITFPVKTIGVRVMPGIGDFAGFETTFTIDRRDFGVLGTRWSGNPLAIDPTIVIHLMIGGVVSDTGAASAPPVSTK